MDTDQEKRSDFAAIVSGTPNPTSAHEPLIDRYGVPEPRLAHRVTAIGPKASLGLVPLRRSSRNSPSRLF